MGVYNKKASLISTLTRVGMIIMVICLVGVANSLAEKENSPIEEEQIEYNIDN